MKNNNALKSRAMGLYALALALVFIIACGGAPAAPPAAEPTALPAVGDTPPPTTAPMAEATPTPAPPAAVTPAGTLNAGLPEIGRFSGHPLNAVNPSLFVSHTVPLGESLMLYDINGQIQGWLLESWEISEDSTTWTMNLHQGVQFHKGYGEMTAEDVVWSYTEGWTQNQPHARWAAMQDFWMHPEGSVETPDRYTVVVNTGVPLSAAAAQQDWITGPAGAGNWVASKAQSDELGVEAADRDSALTGPWEIVESRTAEFWRMRAVEDHWRQTPYFAELVFWELPEESARLAGFQTGQLDTFNMSFDSIPLVESVPGAQLMSVPGGADYSLRFYGPWHAEAVAGNPPAGYDPTLPWVSASAHVDSEEWRRAVMVRQALIMAIDREAIIETILGGYARPGVLMGWGYNLDQLGDRRWEHDPDRARELLVEAGYSNGFRINLTPAIRGAPAEVELCEAIATMWSNELNLDVNFQRIPYETLRPQGAGRTYQGATCHPTSMVFVVGPRPNLTTVGGFSWGATHPFIEDIAERIAGTVLDAEREQLEAELGAFLFDNALTTISLFEGDAVWPLGSRIAEWTQHVKTRDLRLINGYEFIPPRQ